MNEPVEDPRPLEMTSERIVLPDGRYLIYYSFSPSQSGAQKTDDDKVSQSAEPE
ncbi:MAG: hypothetical protein ABR530_08785 [Pyrinomonadaceae bacterium]